MKIVIDNRRGIPIYEQIYEQVKNAIIGGELSPDSPLPSIRNLAKDLRISVITTKRAYEELERDGFIYTAAGKGCFVSGTNTELVRETVLTQIEGHLLEAIRLGKPIGLSHEELKSMIDLLSEEDR